jgi:hypothetical protein
MSAYDPKQTWPSVVLWLLNGGKSQKFGVVSHVSQARCRYVRSRGASVHVRDRKIGELDWRGPVEHAPPQSGDLKQGN